MTGAVRTALADLAASQGRAVTRRVEEHARRGLAAAAEAEDVARLHLLARTSPDPGVAAEAALLVARLHREAGRTREAAAVLESLVVRSPPRQVLARGLWELHETYDLLDEVALERSALRRLAQECPEEKLEDGRSAGQAARDALTEPRFRDAPALLADPRPPLALAWELLQSTDSPPILHLNVRGAWPSDLEDRLLFIQDSALLCVDARSGASGAAPRREFDPVWRSALGVDVRAAFGTRDSVVLVGDDAQIQPRWARVDSVNAADGSVRWSRRLGGQYRSAAAGLGVIFVLRSDVSDTGEYLATLTALSAESGEVVAERRLPGRIHQEVTCVADAVVLYEILAEGGPARRRVHTLDATTLTPRGVVELEGHASPFSVCAPGTAVVVTNSRHDGVAGIDATTGAVAWTPFRLAGRTVKSILAVPNGIVVSDDGDRLRRLDPATGREVWVRDLGGGAEGASLVYEGEAAEGDLVVATLGSSSAGTFESVGIDAESGEIRWRVDLEVNGRGLPHPVLLQDVVAYSIHVRKREGYDCRVVYLSRADGRTLDVVSHPVIGKSLQTVDHRGRRLVLSATPRADVAVYSGAEEPSDK